MYYNENTIIYYDGAFIKASEAKGSLYHQSLHYGFAVFEGIRSYRTSGGEARIFKAKEHFERMKFSCESVSIPYPFDNDELIEISYEVLKRNQAGNAYLRPLITCGENMSLTGSKKSTLLIAAWSWGAYLGEKLLSLKTSTYRRISPSSFHVEAKISGHYVNSILATQEAKSQGFDEALMLDIHGFVAEGPGANIFIEKNGKLFTPERGSILPGITRATVIEICEQLGIDVTEKKISPEEVYDADSVFYCGTAAEVIGVASLDNRTFKKSWDKTQGIRIQKAYKELVLETRSAATLTI
jgi:branched-chain amino acid aminotransferase